MRVAIVGPAAPLRGGIAQHTDALADALGTEHEVDVYAYARQYPGWLFPGRSQFDPGARPRASARVAFDPYRLSTWEAVARDVAERQPDLVLVQWWHPWFAVPLRGLIARLRRSLGGSERLCIVCHNVMPHKRFPFQRALAKAAFEGAGRFVVHAAAEEARLGALLGHTPPTHRAPLPCLAPAGSDEARGDARRALDRGDAPLVLFFGLVRGYKGLPDLIHALAHMRHQDAELLVAGEFYEAREGYERLARELGVAERVTFRDEFVPSEEVPSLFAAADVVALPYRAATQSAVLPFAVHFRRRFVVTDVGGLVEAAQGLGAVVPPRQPDALAAALDDELERGSVQDHGTEAERWTEAARAFSPAGTRAAYEAVARDAAADAARDATIVVAAHGACPHLEATVGALGRQVGRGPREVLVVYDGDAALLRERLAPIAPIHLRVVHEPSRGLNAKRNRGLAEATAGRVLFTDDDCVPDAGWCDGLLTALDAHPIATGAVLPLGDGVRASVRTTARPRSFRGPLAALLPWRAGCGNNLGVQRAFARSLGGFDERIGVGTWSGAACDTEFLFRALRASGGEVFYTPTAVVEHRQEPIGPAVLAKRRGYYRGMSYLARRLHPTSPFAWTTAALRLAGTAVAVAWSTLRFDGVGRRIHAAELRGAVEGLFPPREAAAGPDVHDESSPDAEAGRIAS